MEVQLKYGQFLIINSEEATRCKIIFESAFRFRQVPNIHIEGSDSIGTNGGGCGDHGCPISQVAFCVAGVSE